MLNREGTAGDAEMLISDDGGYRLKPIAELTPDELEQMLKLIRSLASPDTRAEKKGERR